MKEENIYDKDDKLIGQNWQRNNGDWMHKWMDHRTGSFYKFSLHGLAKGEDMSSWTYRELKDKN